jgi:hypothetical protein
MPSDVCLAYFAGFYEGEGYVSNDKSNNNRIRLGIDQNDPTPLYQAQKIWGGSVKQRTRKSPASKKICVGYNWRLCHNKALIFLSDIRKFMRIPYKINQVLIAQEKARTGLNRRFECPHCKKDYASPSGRRRHIKNSH